MDPRAVMVLAALADTAVEVTPEEMQDAREAGAVDPSADLDAERDALQALFLLAPGPQTLPTRGTA